MSTPVKVDQTQASPPLFARVLGPIERSDHYCHVCLRRTVPVAYVGCWDRKDGAYTLSPVCVDLDDCREICAQGVRMHAIYARRGIR